MFLAILYERSVVLMEGLINALNSIDSLLWGVPMIVVLLGHIFSLLSELDSSKKIFTGIKLSVTKDPDGEGDVSQFGALSTALAATIGTGNIIGVATAVTLGDLVLCFGCGLQVCLV